MNKELLLKKFKLSIGDLNTTSTLLDDYYTEKLTSAYEDLITYDISEERLNSELGNAAVVLYAKLLMNDADIANNTSLNLIKNKLSILTRGDSVEDVE